MDKINNILPGVLKKAGLQKKYLEYLVIYNWQKIVGPDIRKHTQPKDIIRGVLVIIVDNPAWCHNLMMMKLNLIKEINDYFGETIIKDIKLLNGSIKNLKVNQINESINELWFKKNQILEVRLNQEEINCIEELSQHTVDEELQNKIKRAYRIHIAVNKLKKAHKWKKCKNCNTLCMPEEEYCSICLRNKKNQFISKIKSILLDMPWLNYQELNEMTSCSKEQYFEARNQLISYFERQIEHNNSNIVKAAYVMLCTGLTPDKINEQVIEETIENNRRKQRYVFAFRRGQRNSVEKGYSGNRF